MATKRKSNKVILGLIGYFVVFLLGMQIFLFARYRNGDIETESMKANFDIDSYPGVRFVLISDLSTVSLNRADTFSVEISKDAEVEKRVDGDTLILSASAKNRKPEERTWLHCSLGLPNEISVIARNAELSINCRDSVTQPVNWNILLNNSNLKTDQPFATRQTNQFGKLVLSVRDDSKAELSSAILIDSLDLTVYGSQFNQNEAGVNQIKLQTDSSAGTVISLSGQSMLDILSNRSANKN